MDDQRRVASNPEDRRQFTRAELKVWVEEKQENATYFHLLSNISIGGLCIQKQLPFSIGAMLNLELKLPGIEGVLSLKGEVVNNYTDPETNILGAGVRFVDISPEVKKKLQKYVDLL